MEYSNRSVRMETKLTTVPASGEWLIAVERRFIPVPYVKRRIVRRTKVVRAAPSLESGPFIENVLQLQDAGIYRYGNIYITCIKCIRVLYSYR